MALNLAKVLIAYLKDRPEEKFTARQIAEWVFATFPAECQVKKARSKFITNDAELVQQLVAEISSQRPVLQKRHLELKTTEGRPRKYYYSERTDSAEVAAVESAGTTSAADASASKVDEHALYPLLSQYLWEEFGVFSKRIDEKRSSNKRGPNGNRWLYPDALQRRRGVAGAGRTLYVLRRCDHAYLFGAVCSANSGRSGLAGERTVLGGLQVGDAAQHSDAPIQFTQGQAKVFEALWSFKGIEMDGERIMQRAGQKSDKPIDLFKIKAKDKDNPLHQARLAAYGAFVVTQQCAGLYAMPCAAVALA